MIQLAPANASAVEPAGSYHEDAGYTENEVEAEAEVGWLKWALDGVADLTRPGRPLEPVADLLGGLVGQLELAGLRLPARAYRDEVQGTPLTRGSRAEHRSDYDELVGTGHVAIVDLCAEWTLDEEYAEQAGLRHLKIRVVDTRSPTLAQVRELFDFLRDLDLQPGERVYIHCEQGNGRTGLFVACYRMAVCGWSLKRALDEAERYTYGEMSPFFLNQRQFLVDFYEAVRRGDLDEYRAVTPAPAG